MGTKNALHSYYFEHLSEKKKGPLIIKRIYVRMYLDVLTSNFTATISVCNYVVHILI